MSRTREENVVVRQTNRGVVRHPDQANNHVEMSLASLIAPYATLAVLGVAGLGAAGLIAPRAAPDAQAALGPLVTSAVLFVTTPLLLVGVAPRLLVGSVLGLLSLVTVARHR